ncbi:hypothetical protein HYH03_018580 [Edaphochlamys debaryana]|uniref:Uncharacterized protein n=1 Tax=Edaphochlamys debaryana TaxID=47281 RepID=A0A836BPC6_9CHLO|nr:hypothetical protein HYH03_018580 [Edaphochlamys debaryana]|eukprot:KAG2482473.1 hypothetical protein HYH03_018580 [Edaphochlamys debaryana]
MNGSAPRWGSLADCVHGGPSAGCNCALVTTGVEQSLDEMEFSRSACAAAQCGDVAKLRRILARNPQAISGDGGSGGSYTPLHYAARAGHLEAVQLLLKSGAPVDAATRGMGATALQRAAGQGHAAVVEALLRAGADAALGDCDGETALHKAAAQGSAEACRLLLSACPGSAGARDKAGRTPGQRATGAAVAVMEAVQPAQPP